MNKKIILIMCILTILIIPLVIAPLWGVSNDNTVYYNFGTPNDNYVTNDVNGSIFNGTLGKMNAASFVTGKIGTGLYFNGSAQNFTMPLWAVSNTSFSVSLWVKPNLMTTDPYFVSAFAGYSLQIKAKSDNTLTIGTGVANHDSVISLQNDTWQFLAVTYNGSQWQVYKNGTNIVNYTEACPKIGGWIPTFGGDGSGGAANVFNGTMDEIGIWNRTLTNAEITELWNNGDGLSSPYTPVVSLVSPADNSNFTKSSITFVGDYSNLGTLINATYYVWNGTGTLVNNSVVVGITGTTNTSTEIVSGFIRGNYSWNILACNSTSSCSFATSNYTFNIINSSLNSEFYNPNAIEGNSEPFQINITLFEGLSITDFNLTYNSTRYSGTQMVSGQNYSLLRTVTAPSISAATGIEFNWTFLFSDGSTYISPSHNQTVSPIGIDDCSVYSKVILNYTLYDEETRILINVTSPNNASMEVDVNISSITNGLTIMNFSKAYTNKSSASVCLNIDLNNSIYRLDSQVRYEASSKVSEFHHIQNYSLTNTTTSQNISLYDLTSTDSTSFLITFKDTNFLPVKDALIDITRKYIADGVFRSVEIPKTDTSGNAVGHFDRDSVIYTIIISKNGEILATFDNVAVVCQDVLIGECTLNLNAASTTIPFTDWDTLGGINYIMSFNKTSRTITTVFTTTDGTNKLVSINTTKFDRFGNTSICTDSLESSAGTLTCVVPGAYGNVTVVAKLYSDGELVTTNTFYAGDSPTVNFGRNGYVFLLIMMLSIPLMFITSTIGVVIGVFLGLIMGALLLIYTGGSIIGIGSTLIWVFVAGAIIIWKINHTEEV